MASFRDSAPESLARTIYRGSDVVTESTYRPETASDHLADSVYRPGTSSDQADTSDSVDETKLPARLKGGLKSRIINQLCEAEDFSANILHIPDQPARLVLQLGPQDATDQRLQGASENARQSRKLTVRNLPPAAENEEYLDIFFESKKRQGGGPVKNVTLMKDKHSAIIEFEHPDAVKRVLDKVPITMHDHVVDVEAMVTLLDEYEDIDSVQITGLRGLADEIRGLEVEGDTNEEAQTPEKTVIIYSGIEAAKIWHFCAKELENIVTNFDALITTDPTSGTPNSLTIEAEKKFEKNIRKRLREVKERLLSLQEGSVADTDITNDFADNISNFNASNDHILLVGDVKRRKVLALFDETFTPESAMEIVRKLISQENDDNTLPVPPAVGSVPVDTAHKLKQEKFITVALEIGELYSGCVYSYKHEYLEDPKQMHIPNWHGIGRLVTNKVSTVVLFDEGMKLHSAGFNAEDEYAELMADSENDDLPWHFFQRFTGFLVGTKGEMRQTSNKNLPGSTGSNKWIQNDLNKYMVGLNHQQCKTIFTERFRLSPSSEFTGSKDNHKILDGFEFLPDSTTDYKVSSDARIKDDKGRAFPARDVIAAMMRYLKEPVIEQFKRRTAVENRDIHWVLILPSHWSDSAKEFLRYSANEAGIEDEQLSLVLQSTAISCYTSVLLADQNRESSRGGIKGSRRKCMIVDLGDEVSSVTVLKRDPNGNQEELFKTFSSAFCALRIRDEFFKFLEQLVGHKVLAQVRDNYQREFLDLKREIEVKVRTYEYCQETKVTFRVPVVFEELFVESTGKRLEEAINASSFRDRLTWQGDKLRCESRIMKTFFDKCCAELVATIRKLMENPQLKDTGVIVMAGELAIPPVIQDTVMKAFPGKEVVIPNEPEFAALKGAVIYGNKSLDVSYRIPKYTYGIIGPTPIHGMQQQQSDTAIQIYFPKGQTVRIGEIRSNPSYIETVRRREWQWKLFASERKFLSTVDDSCQVLATITLTIAADDKPVRVDVDLTFGYSEITVEARDLKTGKSVTAQGRIS